MTWNIHKVQIFRTDQLNRWTFEQTEMFFANIRGVFDGFSSDLMDIRLGTDDTHYSSRIDKDDKW